MSFFDQDQKEEQNRADKFGDYTSDACPNCQRHRVMIGVDNDDKSRN